MTWADYPVLVGKFNRLVCDLSDAEDLLDMPTFRANDLQIRDHYATGDGFDFTRLMSVGVRKLSVASVNFGTHQISEILYILPDLRELTFEIMSNCSVGGEDGAWDDIRLLVSKHGVEKITLEYGKNELFTARDEVLSEIRIWKSIPKVYINPTDM